MIQPTQPPASGDELADAIIELLGRLKKMDPAHPLAALHDDLFTMRDLSHAANNRLHGVVDSFIRRQTDRELLAFKYELERFLQPQLCVVNHRHPQ